MVKQLPSMDEAEKALMGAIINDISLLHKVEKYINEDTLYLRENVVLYKKIVKMIAEGEHVDLATVAGSISSEEVRYGLTPYYVTGLFSGHITDSIAVSYARGVYESYLMRTVISQTNKIQESAYENNDGEAYNRLMDAHTFIGELINMKPTNSFDISQEMDLVIQSIQSGGKNLIKTGFSSLDKLSGGMTRGEITIVGGRPGHGKTTFLVNVLKNLIDDNKRVIMFNREMTNTEMLKKIIALESQRLSYSMIRKGVFDLESVALLEKARESVESKYKNEQFAMFDNLKDFNSSSAEVKRFNPDVIMDDYIQLIVPENSQEQRRLQLEKIVNDYKWLAKSEDASAILASQLNRALESRQNPRPMLSDLAESGAIEQVAENVFFVYYDYKINYTKSKTGANSIDVIGSKVRYGNSGVARLGYDGDRVKLYNTIDDFKESRKREYSNG